MPPQSTLCNGLNLFGFATLLTLRQSRLSFYCLILTLPLYLENKRRISRTLRCIRPKLGFSFLFHNHRRFRFRVHAHGFVGVPRRDE